MQTNHHHPVTTVVTVAISSRRRRFAAPGAAAALALTAAVATLPASASAQDDRTGTNAPHQERHPSAHPELFVGGRVQGPQHLAGGGQIGLNAPHQERNPAQHPDFFARAARGPQRPTTTARRALIAANTLGVVRVPAPADRGTSRPNLPTAETTGLNAPHQERNPAQHPELWSR